MAVCDRDVPNVVANHRGRRLLVNRAVRVIDTLMRGIGQVMFQNNLSFAKTPSGAK